MLRIILLLLPLVVANDNFKSLVGGERTAVQADPGPGRFTWVRHRVEPPWLCTYVARVPWFCDAAESTVFQVKPERNTVDSLKDAIKTKMGTDYTGNPANFIVYPPATPISADLDDGPMTPSTAALDPTDAVDNPWHSAKNPYEFDAPDPAWWTMLVWCGVAFATLAVAYHFREIVLHRDRTTSTVLNATLSDEGAGGMKKLTIQGAWLTHPADTNNHIVFVRPVHEKLWEVVQKAHAVPHAEPNGHVLVIGNPGIGKSWSLNYLLYRALKEKLTPVVILRSTHGWHCFSNGKCVELNEFPGKTWVDSRLQGNQRALLLHDVGKATDPADVKLVHGVSYGRVCIVLASSPKEENFAGFLKSYQPRKFYCAPLSRAEFLALHPDKQEVFDKFGGVLRDVSLPVEERQKLLKTAIENHDFSSLKLATVSEKDSHRIICVVPDGDENQGSHLAFLSRYIEASFWDAKAAAEKSEVRRTLYRKLTDSISRGIYGIPFEDYVHHYAASLKFAELTNVDGTPANPAVKVDVPKEGFRVKAEAKQATPPKSAAENTGNELKRIVDECAKNKKARWIQPENRNFPVIDALLVITGTTFGVQITISDDHRPTLSALKELNEHGITFGTQPHGDIHLHGVIFVVDAYRQPLLGKKQSVQGDPTKDDPAEAVLRASWNAASNPQYRMTVTCRELEKA